MPSATDLVSFARCPHRVHLDATGDPSERVPASAFLQLLWESGNAHEARVIAGMEVVPVDHDRSTAERIAATLDLMRAGTPRIYHGYLEAGDLSGEPDLLERVDYRSALGPFSYIPVDIKCASAFEHGDPDKPKRHYLMQLSAYAELLEPAQGWRPDIGRIIDADGEAQTLDLGSFESEYEEAREQISAILRGEHQTQPGWKSGECPNCAWQAHCWAWLKDADDLTTIAGIGEGYRTKLWTIGVQTAADLADTQPEQLGEAKGVGPSRAVAWPRQARAQKRGTPEILAPWMPPSVEFEVSYDIEDFTPDPFVYLHGLLVRESSAPKYGSVGHHDGLYGIFEPVCAELPADDERSVWTRFLAKVAEYERRGSYAVYVYSHHEKTTLTKLAAKYGGSRDLDEFIERFVDLESVVKECVVFPTDSRGLKSLARYIGFNWRDEDPGGSQSMAWWAEYFDAPVEKAALRDRVIAYNEDDVRASFVLRDWLEQHTVGRSQ